MLRSTEPPLVVPTSVIAEACYLIGKYLGATAEATLLRSLTGGRYQTEAPTDMDLWRAAGLVEQYADLPLGGTDALVIATAERLGIETLATLDQRHFNVVRPAHLAALMLVP